MHNKRPVEYEYDDAGDEYKLINLEDDNRVRDLLKNDTLRRPAGKPRKGKSKWNSGLSDAISSRYSNDAIRDYIQV